MCIVKWEARANLCVLMRCAFLTSGPMRLEVGSLILIPMAWDKASTMSSLLSRDDDDGSTSAAPSPDRRRVGGRTVASKVVMIR